MSTDIAPVTYRSHQPQPMSWAAEEPEIFVNKYDPILTSAEKRYFYARPRIQKLMADLARKKEQLQRIVDIN